MKLKAPTASLDYTYNWDDGYLDTGETIVTSTWTVSPTGMTIDSESETATTATVKLSGGTHGVLYKVVNTITTNVSSRGDTRTLLIRVWQHR